MTAQQTRAAARVIVLDQDDRVLLLRYDENGGFWATPGGSLDLNETHESAAQRELHEELGIDDITLGPQLAIRAKEHLVGGRLVRQVERYYVTRIDAADLDPTLATQPDNIRAWKWWSSPDLANSQETIHPAKLSNLIADYLALGAPETPIELIE